LANAKARPAKTKVSISQTFARTAIGAREKKEHKSGIARTKPDAAVARHRLVCWILSFFVLFCSVFVFSAPPSISARPSLCIFVLFLSLFFFFLKGGASKKVEET
jgi:hypothetical protein